MISSYENIKRGIKHGVGVYRLEKMFAKRARAKPIWLTHRLFGGHNTALFNESLFYFESLEIICATSALVKFAFGENLLFEVPLKISLLARN